MRAFFIFSFVGMVAFAQAPPPTERNLIQLPNSSVMDFAHLYHSLTKKKVWVDAELAFNRKISIFIRQPIPRAEAISLIRETLRKEGIEIREVGDSEAYISRVAP